MRLAPYQKLIFWSMQKLFLGSTVVWWLIPLVFQKMVQVIFRMIHVTSCLLYRSLKGQWCNVWEEWFEVQNYTAASRVVYHCPLCCASFIQWRFSCQNGGVKHGNDMTAVCIWVLVALFLVVLCSLHTLCQYIRRILTFCCFVGCASHLNPFVEHINICWWHIGFGYVSFLRQTFLSF